MNQISIPANLEERHLSEVAQIVRTIWAGKLIVLLCSCVLIALAMVYLRAATYSYTGTLVLIPTQTRDTGLVSRLGELASLAGVNAVNGQILPPFTLYPDALKSRAVADELSRRQDLMRTIFKTQWDEASQAWREPVSSYRSFVNDVKPFLGLPVFPWRPPSGAELQLFIARQVKVLENPRKSIVTLTMNDADPQFAATFLQALHETTDQLLRRLTLDRSSAYAKYIQSQLTSVQVNELRQVLIQALSEQMTLVIMSSSNTTFAAQPLGPAQSSSRPTQPVPTLTLLFSALLGAVIGMALLFLGVRMPASRRRSRVVPVVN